MFGKLNSPEMIEVLNSQLIGHLACVDQQLPYIVPVSYAYEDYTIYVYSGKGKKLDILRTNPAVCFQVDDTRNLSNWKSVVCYGKFQELSTAEEKNKAFSILSSRKIPYISSKTMQLSAEWPFSEDHSEQLAGVFFKITVHEMTGRFEKADGANYYAS